jgi:hypothetical protein
MCLLKRKSLSLPIILTVLNVLLIFPLLEELKDASEPNYGYITIFISPVIAIITIVFVIKQLKVGYNKLTLWSIIILNVILFIFPIGIIFLMSLSF